MLHRRRQTEVRKTFQDYLPLAVAALVYGIWYFAFLYAPGLIRFDDFGYVQTVASSIAEHRFHLHDWLGPYHIPPTLLAVATYRLTGHFLWSTWGLLALFSGINLVLLYAWFKTRLNGWSSALSALAMVTFPVYAHKTSEYSGNVFALFCVLSALWAYRHAWWIPFYLLAFLGYATRQNLLALLILPLVLAIFPGERRLNRIYHGIAFLLFGIGVLAIRQFSPPNFMQVHEVYRGLTLGNAIPIASAFILGLAVCLLLFAFGQVLFIPRRESGGDGWIGGLRQPWRLALGAGTVFFLFLHPIPYLSFLTPLIGTLDRGRGLQVLLAGGLLAAILVVRPVIRLPLGALGLVLALVGISCLRGFWYDFYFLEIAVAMFFFLMECSPVWHLSRLGKGILLAALFGNLIWAYAYKVQCDKQFLIQTAYEHLERQGLIQPWEMTDGTFGFLGWKLFDHYKDHDYHGTASDFQCYVQRDQVVIESEAPWRRGFRQAPSDSSQVLASGMQDIGYFPLRYRAIRLGHSNSISLCGNAPLPLPNDTYRVKPLPLNEAEWRGYLGKLASKPK